MVTSKGIPVSYTNLQLNPYPNTQLDLFYNDNLFFSMHGSQYVTNQFDAQIPVRVLLTNLIKMLAAKFFSSSTRWRSRSSLVTKPYGVQTQQLLQEKDELRQILSLVTICMNITLLHTCATLDSPQKNPYICLGV